MGEEDIIARVLTSNAVSEASQYNFDMEKISVTPKNIKLPNDEDNHKGISGLEEISNTFKEVNILTNIDIWEQDPWHHTKQKKARK